MGLNRRRGSSFDKKSKKSGSMKYTKDMIGTVGSLENVNLTADGVTKDATLDATKDKLNIQEDGGNNDEDKDKKKKRKKSKKSKSKLRSKKKNKDGEECKEGEDD